MEHLLVTAIVTLSAVAVIAPVVRGSRREAKNDSPCGGGCGGCNLGCDVKSKFAVAGALLMLLAGPAQALDTVETFDPGASNAEYYAGLGGLGKAAVDRELSNELVLGYGILDGLSAHLGTCVAVDQQRFQGESSLCFGLIGTPLQTDHVDVDLLLDIGAAGNGLGTLSMTPMVELNYDADPEMGTWGIYLRGGWAAYGQPNLANDAVADRLLDFAVNPGAYLRITPRHQLLVEYDRTTPVGAGREGEDPAHGWAFGLNSEIGGAFELITELRRDTPVAGERATWGLTLGFIAGLPTGN